MTTLRRVAGRLARKLGLRPPVPQPVPRKSPAVDSDVVNPFVPFNNEIPYERMLHVPVIVLNGIGIAPERIPDLVDEVKELQLALLDFRPLFVTDHNNFAPFRRYGFMVEYIMPSTKWADVAHARTWERYRDDRLVEIIGQHSPRRIIDLEEVAAYRQAYRSFLS